MTLNLPGIFVTGTDTGVGKTAVAGALAGALRAAGVDVAVMKPVQTGVVKTESGLRAPDADYLRLMAGVDDPDDLICPAKYVAPVAPVTAAEQEGKTVNIAAILGAYRALRARHTFLIVEGAGGLAVPLTRNYLMSDLARDMGLPLLVVSRSSLGTINHTLLTVEFARRAGLGVMGIVINRYPSNPDLAEQTSPSVIEKLCNVPILAILPDDSDVDTERGNAGRTVESVRKSLLFQRICPQTTS